MKTPRTLLLIAMLLACCAISAAAQSQDVFIRGGWLFDSIQGELVPNNGIWIRAGEFFLVGEEPAPQDLTGAKTIELTRDDTILPGIIDLHAHHNVNLFGRLRRDEYSVNPIVFLANGVTSTFPAGEYDPEGMAEASRRIDRGEQIGARILNSGPYFGTARRGWNKNATVDEINAEVDRLAALGVAGLKAKGINPIHLRALIERSHMHGLTVAGHLGSGYRNTVNPRDAVLMGIDRVEHFLGGDALTPDRSAYSSLVDVVPGTPEFKRIADLFIRHRVYFDATITAYGYFGKRGEEYERWEEEPKFFTPFVQDAVRSRPPHKVNEQFERIYWAKQKTIKAFFDAGGWITLGTDHASTGEYLGGFAAHRELDAFVRSGIPPADALQIATRNNARALHLGGKLGSIEVGKLADLFVIKGNPLENIRNTRKVHLVMKGGKVYDPKELLKSVMGKLGPRNAAEAESW